MLRSFVVMIFTLSFSAICFACPFTILNDLNSKVLAVDPFNHQAIELGVGQHAVIDPSVYSWQKYFRHEKLDIYYPIAPNSANFVRRYQLTEKFCEDDADKNQLKISDIVGFVKEPSKRFEAKVFHPKPKSKHQGKHQH